MAITGTGTQADPFTFDPTGMTADEVWADFKGCLAKTGTESAPYVYCSLPENYILDFNDVHDTIGNVPININIIIGNGFTVKNLSSSNNIFVLNTSKPIHFYDLNIINSYGLSLFSCSSSSPVYNKCFYGCVLTGVFTTSSSVFNYLNSNYRPSIYFQESPYSRKGCGINIECLNGSLLFAGKDTFCNIIDSHIIFKGKSFTKHDEPGSIRSNVIVKGLPERIDYVKIINSLIEGSFDYLFLIDGSMSSVVNVEMDETSGRMYCMNTMVGNIYNSDKATLTYAQPKAQLIGVTSEQMRDAQYLESIGFPIGVD